MRIKLTSIMVDDQDKALQFYTECWASGRSTTFRSASTGGSPSSRREGPDDLELALEPNANPAGKAFQEAMFAQGIPLDRVRGRRHRRRVRAAEGAAASRSRANRRRGPGHDRRVRGHLRQPDSAVSARLGCDGRLRTCGRRRPRIRSSLPASRPCAASDSAGGSDAGAGARARGRRSRAPSLSPPGSRASLLSPPPSRRAPRRDARALSIPSALQSAGSRCSLFSCV